MLVIFDWDGTLLNSEAKIVRCMQAAMRSADLPVLDAAEVSDIIGLGLDEAILQLHPQSTAEARDRMRRAYAEHFIAAEQVPCEFFPGALAFISKLQTAGHKLAVATGKSRRGLNRVLTALDKQNLFDATRCADETRSKPDPLMLRELLAETASAPEQALMIGDTVYDLNMANAAGVPAIGVSFGVHDTERLQSCKPLRVVDSYAELDSWWDKYSAAF